MKLAFGMATSETAKRELASLDDTGQQVLQLSPPKGVKVFVLSAKLPMKEHSELADDANRKRVALAGLYPGATQIWVDSGHAIPLEKPEAVVSAIRDGAEVSTMRCSPGGRMEAVQAARRRHRDSALPRRLC